MKYTPRKTPSGLAVGQRVHVRPWGLMRGWVGQIVQVGPAGIGVKEPNGKRHTVPFELLNVIQGTRGRPRK
jgi:hypothetical protein